MSKGSKYWVVILSVMTMGSAFETASRAQQVTAYYQPTPYPPVFFSNPPATGTGIHVIDGWLPSVYYGKTFQLDERLRIGGWGDEYRTYIQFDLTGLPCSDQTSKCPVTDATLMLYEYKLDSTSTLTNYNLALPQSAWADPDNLTTTMTWATQPPLTDLQDYPAGNNYSWWSTDLTSLYSNWQTGIQSNFGIALIPDSMDDNFDTWRSSRFKMDSKRPILVLTYVPPVTLPQFKLPLPGGLSWLITTEAGGHDCMGLFDKYHTDKNYFSIDFSWITKEGGYGQNDNIPIIAAADGTVIFAGQDQHLPGNGIFVVVQHGAAGGFQSRYLHLKKSLVRAGQAVQQGDELGYMGHTGQEKGVHLHFGLRYGGSGSDDDGSGASKSNVQYALVDGWLMKGIQTECTVDKGGNPVDYDRYYLSSNRTYPNSIRHGPTSVGASHQ